MHRMARQVRILEDRLLSLLRDLPGLTRAEIAATLALTGDELDRPVTQLLQAGLVRTERDQGVSRYWLTVVPLRSSLG
jgi:DNA-binding MarR family transcriptional regulator